MADIKFSSQERLFFGAEMHNLADYMKTNKILAIGIILFVLFQTASGQEKTSAVLFSELQSENCELYWARIDAFFSELQKEPQTKGFVVIYGEENELLENLNYERWTNGITNFRGFDGNRIKVVRGVLGENRKIQFWKVLNGEEIPLLKKGSWSYRFSDSTKPFIFTDYNYYNANCPSSPSAEKYYADVLLANTSARGHLVIRGKTNKNMRKIEKEVLNRLVNDYKVPPARLKVFYVKDKKHQKLEADIEFWFVP